MLTLLESLICSSADIFEDISPHHRLSRLPMSFLSSWMLSLKHLLSQDYARKSIRKASIDFRGVFSKETEDEETALRNHFSSYICDSLLRSVTGGFAHMKHEFIKLEIFLQKRFLK